MFIVFYTVKIVYICVFMACSASYWLCDIVMDPHNVCVCVYIYIYIYIYMHNLMFFWPCIIALTFQNTKLVHNSFNLQQYICYTTLLNMVRAARCSSSGGPIVLPQPLVSSPSVSSRTVCRWRADCSPLSTCILYGCLQRVTIPEAVVIQLIILMISSVLLETCWGV